ncbi:MAG TPA: hypothetical protein VF092_06905, partial [Longimicrobium sp.]
RSRSSLARTFVWRTAARSVVNSVREILSSRSRLSSHPVWARFSAIRGGRTLRYLLCHSEARAESVSFQLEDADPEGGQTQDWRQSWVSHVAGTVERLL